MSSTPTLPCGLSSNHFSKLYKYDSDFISACLTKSVEEIKNHARLIESTADYNSDLLIKIAKRPNERYMASSLLIERGMKVPRRVLDKVKNIAPEDKQLIRLLEDTRQKYNEGVFAFSSRQLELPLFNTPENKEVFRIIKYDNVANF